MSAQDRASELLAQIEAKADESINAIRERAAALREQLEQGMLNLQSSGPQQSAASPAQSGAEADLNWDLEAEANAEHQAPVEPALAEEPPPSDDDLRFTAPEPAQSFKDELDVATDEFGIPLGD